MNKLQLGAPLFPLLRPELREEGLDEKKEKQEVENERPSSESQ